MIQALVGGVTSGAIYALLGLGIVIVYNVSGFVNLAQGEYYVYGALTTTTLVAIGVPLVIAALVAVITSTILGAATQRMVFSRLTRASHASQLLAGIGVAIALAGLARVIWGTHERSLPLFWARSPFRVAGARVGSQTVILVALLAFLLVVLWWLFKRTLFGVRMRAVSALNERAGLFAVNVATITTAAFALAGAVGALAGIAITPLVFVTYHSGLHLTIYGFIAGAFGNLRSIPLTVVGGLCVGVLEALMAYYGSSSLKTPFAFTLLVLLLLYRASRQRTGRGVLPSLRAARDRVRTSVTLPVVVSQTLSERFYSTRASAIGVGLVVLLAVAGPMLFSPYWVSLWSFVGVFVIVGIGLDILLGYTGQLSLGQTTFMGISAYSIALSVRHLGVPAWIAIVIALTVTLIVAGAVGLVVLRLRGYYFTLATLALAIAAEALAKGMPGTLGGPTGLRVRSELSLGGFSLNTPARLFTFTWLVVAVALVVALRLTRARIGRAMRAVGADEELAGATSIDPYSTKLKAFIVSAMFAGVAGVLYAHILMFVSPHSLGLVGGLDSIVGLLLGGIGTVWGALIGIPIIRLAPQLFDRFSTYQELIYGVVIVGMVLALPDGIVGGMRRFGRRVGVTLSRYPEESSGAVAKDGDAGRLHVVLERSDLDPASAVVGTRLDIATVVLSAQNISKRFGGIQALSDVALSARSGSIVGLIGPNGAGKSTFLSVLAGGLTPDTGQIHLQGRDITGFDAASRAASGLSRTFQLPRIPHHMSVLELATLGAHRRGSSGAIRAVLGATGAERRALEQAGMEALEKTGIAHLSTLPASKLSTGEQKLLELARALAASPEVLLADEPAGGLFDEEIARLGEVLNSLTTNGLAVVLVEHHMNLVMDVCSEICVLQEGRVIAVGSPAEIQTNHQVLDAYLGV